MTWRSYLFFNHDRPHCSVFDSYGPYIRGLDRKPRAVMVSQTSGQITAYALDALQVRHPQISGVGRCLIRI